MGDGVLLRSQVRRLVVSQQTRPAAQQQTSKTRPHPMITKHFSLFSFLVLFTISAIKHFSEACCDSGARATIPPIRYGTGRLPSFHCPPDLQSTTAADDPRRDIAIVMLGNTHKHS